MAMTLGDTAVTIGGRYLLTEVIFKALRNKTNAAPDTFQGLPPSNLRICYIIVKVNAQVGGAIAWG